MTVDSHIHLYDSKFGRFAWPPPGSPFDRKFDTDDFIDAAQDAAIDSAVLIGCSDEPELTQKLLDATEKSLEIVAVIGQVRVDSVDFSEEYERFSHYGKFRGIRFANKTVQGIQMARNIASVNGKSANIIEILGHWKRTLMLDGLIRDNPNVIFVIEHFK